MNANTKEILKKNDVLLIKEEKIETKIFNQAFTVKYNELTDLTIFEKYIVKVINELKEELIIQDQKIDYKQIAQILCLDSKLVESNISKLVDCNILTIGRFVSINWTDELFNWQKKVINSKKFNLYFNTSDYEIFERLDHDSKHEIVVNNVNNLLELELVEIIFDAPTTIFEVLNIVIFFDKTRLQLSTLVEHDHNTFTLENVNTTLGDTYKLTNYNFVDMSLWEFSEIDEHISDEPNNKTTESITETSTTIDNLIKLEISLTPSMYIENKNERDMRDSLFSDNIQNPNLQLVHDHNDRYDNLAVKVICNNIFVGFVLKYRDKENIEKFCFDNGVLKKNLVIKIENKQLVIYQNEINPIVEQYNPTYFTDLKNTNNIKVEKENPKIVEINKFDDNREKSIKESFNPTYFTDLKNTNNIEQDIDDLYFSNLKKDLERNKYEDHVRSIQNPNFEKIRKYCENLTKENQADEMQKYLAENGKMKKALMHDSLEQFIENLNGNTITLIDWGCGQGIGSMLVLDYIKQKQLEIVIDEVVLIDDNQNAINRARVQIEALLENNFNFSSLDRIKNSTTLHLFINDKIPAQFPQEDFNKFKGAYFICITNENNQIVNSVYSHINKTFDVQNVSTRADKIGKFNRYEKVFKINQCTVIDINDYKIPF